MQALDTLLARHDLLPLAWEASVAAARFLRDERPHDLVIESKSSPVDSVTEMDRGAEQGIVGTLLGARPDDGFLGEEGGERIGTSGVRWVVDPLDGTVNYLYRMPMWGVSVAAEIDEESVIGIVVLPEFDEAYVGIAGGGAWLVRHALSDPIIIDRLEVRACADLATAMIATGFGYSAQRRQEQAAVILAIAGQVRDFRRSGCATVDFCWLARGRLDGYYERGLNRWDVAAGSLIAAEAGAVVTGLWGDSPHEETMVAGVPAIAPALRAALRTAQG
ncbi:MAG: inositol monophosphatase family protein [Candidatus Nanopelagicales bacterium]|nr:inositol monophosphatase family protein [Candidatus Nanopelagicales bacterium]